MFNSPDYLEKVFIDSFIAETFRKNVSDSETHEYKLSAIYAEKLHKAGGGFIFPSVKSAGAMNIAVPGEVFDTKFEVLDTHLLEVVDSFSYGLYQLRNIGYTSTFSPNGDINWSVNKQLIPQIGQYFGQTYDPMHIGWRLK